MAIPSAEQLAKMDKLISRWQDAARADHILSYGSEYLSSFRDTTRYTVGKKMFHLVIGSSSAFLVDIDSGIIYGNKGWLKVDYNKIIGNAYNKDFHAEALVRDRFRYGHFENAADGNLLQPIVKR